MDIRRALTFTTVGILLGAVLGMILWGGIPGGGTDAGFAPTGSPLTPVAAALVGARAPDFSGQDLDGTTYRLSDLHGRPVVLNFWATWCEPCRAEMPLLETRAHRFADQDLLVLGVNFDEPASVVSAYRAELGLSFPLVLDPGGKVQASYRVVAYPTTFFVDPEGIVRAQHMGVLDEATLDAYLSELGLGGYAR